MNRKAWIILLGLLAIGNFILYYPTHYFFLNDDFIHLPLAQEGKFFQNAGVRILHELLVQFDLMIWGKHAFGFHITTLILYSIVCIQVYYLSFSIQLNLFKTNIQQAQNISFFAVVLFFIYPQHTESLAWILGRTAILSCIFLLITIQIYFSKKINVFNYFLSAISFLLALLTYEQAILLPIVFLIVYFTKDSFFTQRIKYVVALVVSVIIFIVIKIMGTHVFVTNYFAGNFLSNNLWILLANYARLNFRLFLNPSTISLFYVAAILLSILIGFVFFELKQTKKLTNFFFYFVILQLLIIPVSSLGISLQSFESGRYLFIPSVFLVMMISKIMIHLYHQYAPKNKMVLVAAMLFGTYWVIGKINGAIQYQDASKYVSTTYQSIENHFKQTSDTLQINAVQLTIHKLPVFRLGFKEGIQWLHPTIDTNKIIVQHFYTDFRYK